MRVATGGSKPSALALQEACKLAAGSEARLRIVHVIDSPYAYADTWYAAMSVDADAVQRAGRSAGQEVLNQAAAQVRQAGVGVETALLETDGRRVSRVIVDDAEQWPPAGGVIG